VPQRIGLHNPAALRLRIDTACGWPFCLLVDLDAGTSSITRQCGPKTKPTSPQLGRVRDNIWSRPAMIGRRALPADQRGNTAPGQGLSLKSAPVAFPSQCLLRDLQSRAPAKCQCAIKDDASDRVVIESRDIARSILSLSKG